MASSLYSSSTKTVFIETSLILSSPMAVPSAIAKNNTSMPAGTWIEKLIVREIHVDNKALSSACIDIIRHIWEGHLKEVQDMLSKNPELLNLRIEEGSVWQYFNPSDLNDIHEVSRTSRDLEKWNLQHLACYKKHVKIAAHLHTLQPHLFFDLPAKSLFHTPSSAACQIAKDVSEEGHAFFSDLLHTDTFDSVLFNPTCSLTHLMACEGNTRNVDLIFQRFFAPYTSAVKNFLNDDVTGYPKPLAELVCNYLPLDGCIALQEKINSLCLPRQSLASSDTFHRLLSAARCCQDTEQRISMTRFLLQAGADPDLTVEVEVEYTAKPNLSKFAKISVSIRYMHALMLNNGGHDSATQDMHRKNDVEFTQILNECGKAIPSPSSVTAEEAYKIFRAKKDHQRCLIQ